MSEEKPGELAPEIEEGMDNPEKPAAPTDEPTEPNPEGDGGDIEKEEGDAFYKEQLTALEEENERLKEEATERDRQIAIKDRALQASKKPRDVPKIEDRDALKQELLSEVRSEFSRTEARRFIETVTEDKTEREVFLRHYEKSPKTGDIQKDVLGAIATANAPRILELLGRSKAEEADEDRSISAMGGEGVRSPRVQTKSALRKEVEKLLPKEAHKFIQNHVPR